jgi:predicted N-acetyltransferase YhbS
LNPGALKSCRRRSINVSITDAYAIPVSEVLDAEGWEIVFVLGDPSTRFGFDPAGRKRLHFALRRTTSHGVGPLAAVPRLTGKIGYAPAFAALG